MLDYQINKAIQESYRKVVQLTEADEIPNRQSVKDDTYYDRRRDHRRRGSVHDEVKAMFGDTAEEIRSYDRSHEGGKRYLENPDRIPAREKPIEVKFDAEGRDVTDYPSYIKTDVYGNPTTAALLDQGKEDVINRMANLAAMSSPAVRGARLAGRGASRLAKIGRKAADGFGRLWTRLNNPKLTKGALLRYPAGMAVSKGLESGVNATADYLEDKGMEPESKQVRNVGGWLPFMIAPTGSMARYGLGYASEYMQDRLGNEETKDAVGTLHKTIGYGSEYANDVDDTEEVDTNADYDTGTEVETDDRTDDNSYPCTDCSQTFKDYDSLLSHFESQHLNTGMEDDGDVGSEDVDVADDELYKCPDCSQTFDDYDSLLSHFESQHLGE